MRRPFLARVFVSPPLPPLWTGHGVTWPYLFSTFDSLAHCIFKSQLYAKDTEGIMAYLWGDPQLCGLFGWKLSGVQRKLCRRSSIPDVTSLDCLGVGPKTNKWTELVGKDQKVLLFARAPLLWQRAAEKTADMDTGNPPSGNGGHHDNSNPKPGQMDNGPKGQAGEDSNSVLFSKGSV